jgi:hypothetical protein
MYADDLATSRAMTPGDRLALALQLSEMCWHWLDVPDAAAGDRKWAAWNREHDLSNEALLEALRRHALAEHARDRADCARRSAARVAPWFDG